MAHPIIFDENLVDRRLAQVSLDHMDQLFEPLFSSLQERLSFIKRDFKHILILGFPWKRLKTLFSPKASVTFAISEKQENISSMGPFDLVVSCLHLQWANDVLGDLKEIRHLLQPDGAFLGVCFGEDTLYELRDALLKADLSLRSGVYVQMAPMIRLEDMARLVQVAGYKLPVVDKERYSFQYDSLQTLLSDIKKLGLGHGLKERYNGLYTPKYFQKLAQILPKKSHQLEVTITFLYILGWSPSDDQPKPLQKGSAKASLTQVLES